MLVQAYPKGGAGVAKGPAEATKALGAKVENRMGGFLQAYTKGEPVAVYNSAGDLIGIPCGFVLFGDGVAWADDGVLQDSPSHHTQHHVFGNVVIRDGSLSCNGLRFVPRRPWDAQFGSAWNSLGLQREEWQRIHSDQEQSLKRQRGNWSGETTVPVEDHSGADSPFIERHSFGWLRERDIDLLLCAELQDEGPLRDMFEDELSIISPFEGAWVSHAELEGENDLVIAWRGEKRTLALIENKISANFQPEQGARYAARAARWEMAPDVDRVVTVLVAPADYLGNPGSETFGHHLSYESVAERLRFSYDARTRFLASALEAGVASHRAGYVAVPDEQVSDVWQAIWATARSQTPCLRMPRPSAKPGRSVWIYFREAEGLQPYRKLVRLVLKADRGYADLQFTGKSEAELHVLSEGLLSEGMEVVPASKSSSIRLTVQRIDFRGDPQPQLPAISSALRACERLRAFMIQHRSTLAQAS